MAITRVGDAAPDISVFSANPAFAVGVAGVASGDMVLLRFVLGGASSPTISSITDSGGNSYSLALETLDTGTSNRVEIWFSILGTALVNGNNITIHLSGNGAVDSKATDFSGIASSPVDQTNATVAAPTANPWTSPTVTPSQGLELLIGQTIGFDGNRTSAPDTGWNEDKDVTAQGFNRWVTQYQIVSSVAGYQSSGTWDGAGNAYTAQIVTFKGFIPPDGKQPDGMAYRGGTFRAGVYR